MSDDERLNLRDLPPVPELDHWPARYSQTLLRNADSCLRSAYLYVKYNGGTPGHQLDRGTLAHAAFERMTLDMLSRGASRLWEPEFTQDDAGAVVQEDPAIAARQVASLTAAVVDEVYAEDLSLTVPTGDKDDVRVMAYHWAVGMQLDPNTVVAVERKFVMDIAGHEVSGKIDLASISGEVADVVDYKTSLDVPDKEKYERSFQGKLYALLLCFGHPVERVPCGDCDGWGGRASVQDAARAKVSKGDIEPSEKCESCKGRGTVERREDPIGERVAWVRTRELYPRYLDADGSLRQRDAVRSRTELADFRADVERLIERLDNARESWKFPAISGYSHCNQCPCEPECPLPAHLRRYAGAINTHEQAAEAAEWADRTKDRVAATEKELRGFAGAHGPIRYGADLRREFVASDGRAVKKVKGRSDWDGLVDAVTRAAELGEPFAVDEWVKPTQSMSFKRVQLTADELALESDNKGESDERSADERFGVDAPF